MKHKKHSPFFSQFTLKRAGIVVACMAIAFGVGVGTAGERPVIKSTLADEVVRPGDFDNDGHLTAADARIALEFANGIAVPTAADLAHDPFKRGSIGRDTALWILENLDK